MARKLKKRSAQCAERLRSQYFIMLTLFVTACQ